MIIGGRALFVRVTFALINSDKLRMPINLTWSHNMGDKVRVRKGKQPRPPAKVPKYMLSGKAWWVARQLGCWLRSSHHLRVRHSLLVE